MKQLDIFKRAGKNLRQAKTRTALTSLAIGVGALTISLAMAAGVGGRAFTEEMVNTSGDIYSLNVYPRFEAPDESNEELPEFGVVSAQATEVRRMTDKDIAQIRTLGGVESINPMLSISSQYVTRGEGYPKRIAPLSIKADRTELKLAAGSLQDHMPQKGEVSVSESFLSSLGFKDASSAIGRSLFISIPKSTPDTDTEEQSRTFELTVAAVDKPTDTTIYYEASIRISTEDSQQMYEYQNGTEAGKEYYGVTILAREGTDIATLQRQITEEGYQVYSLEDMRESLLQVVDIAQWGLAGFGALAILASIFGIINTQYISVLERTQQIGLMKALGTRSRDISRLFRYEAAWIGLLGGVLGVALAWLITLANPLAASWLELEEGTQLLQVDWVANAILVTALMCVAVVSGYFPARKAARLDPIEALRAE